MISISLAVRPFIIASFLIVSLKPVPNLFSGKDLLQNITMLADITLGTDYVFS
jgi:hypothetical protein